MYNPVASYRLQFHKDFSFKEFEEAIPYLQSLGVSTIYASPIFESVPGSTHGYDGINPHNINPEIGTIEQFYELNKNLQQQGIGWLQDIVPNHMAFHTGNPWLMDVLEKGPKSVYASFFDMSFTGKIFHGRIMVPFLGSPLKDVIENKEIKVDHQQQRLVFNYFDNYYPLNNLSYITILKAGSETPSQAIQQLLDLLPALRQVEDPKTYALEWDEFLLQFNSLSKHEEIYSYLKSCLQKINDDPALLLQIADEQVYQLNHWQRTDRKINFRRFFTVNGLIALNIHYDEVFQYHHQLIKTLIEDGSIQGLRIDHIDGLYDPAGYLEDVRQLTGDDTYIVVEKILEPHEELPNEWPIQGNSGYDFLSIVNNLFTEKSSEEQFTHFYRELVEDDTPVHQQIREKKAFILTENMNGELKNLVQLFQELNLAEADALDRLNPDELDIAIGEFLIECPVYRYYGNKLPLQQSEADAVKKVIENIRGAKPALSNALDLLEKAVLQKPFEQNEEYNAGALRFYQRCMQFTGPLMAKGVEDTLMYTYNRFIGHNEVGDAPQAFGLSVEDFHKGMVGRQKDWPLSLNGTSTHDTKRGEDVRARLNVLTDLPDEWLEAVKEWRRLNADIRVNNVPDDNDEYFIYQTLLGAFAMPGQDEDDISNRLQEYLQKALREAKVNSNWSTPDEEYENATKAFAVKLLDKERPFWKSFTKFHEAVADYGVVNSLSQVLLRFTCPGVPDTYQGTEGWDLSLVDPDNRRPADYKKLDQWLNEIEEESKEGDRFLKNLWANRFDAKIKLWLVHSLFNIRKQEREIFAEGEYIPLTVEGEYKSNVIAFAREHQKKIIVVVAPLHIAQICKSQQKQIDEIDWKDTVIHLPENVISNVENLLSKTSIKVDNHLGVQTLFSSVPVAVLRVEQQ